MLYVCGSNHASVPYVQEWKEGDTRAPDPFAACYHKVPWDLMWATIESEAAKAGVTKVFVATPPKFRKWKLKIPASSKLKLESLDDVALVGSVDSRMSCFSVPLQLSVCDYCAT